MRSNPRTISLTAALLAVALIPGWTRAAEDTKVTKDEVVAEVNGTPITNTMVSEYRDAALATGKGPSSEQAVVQELVRQELIYQDAEAQGVAKDPEFTRQLQTLRRNLMIATAMKKYLASHPVKDEEVQKIYDDLIKRTAGKEYKARHILLETEDEAAAVIVELDNGADFAELAKSKSTGPSGKQGGDLGWFRSGQMVKPFSDAAAKLEKGKYTKKPVKTQFGWHVILLEDERDLQPPPLSEVKPRIVSLLEQQTLLDYIKGLQAKAKVEIKDTGSEEKK